MRMLRGMFNEVRENIRSEKILFTSTLIMLSIIFLMTEIFTAYIFNLNKVKDFVEINMQVKIYLEENLTKEGMSELQGRLLGYSEIKSLKFVSKELALKQLEKSLEMDLDNSDNPLPNTILASLSSEINIKEFKANLIEEEGIEDVDIRGNFIEKLDKFVKSLNKIVVYLVLIVAIPMFIIVFNLIHSSVSYRKEDIEIMSLLGASNWYIKLPFILEGIINAFLSSLISIAVFIPIYKFFEKSLEVTNPIIAVASFAEIFPNILLVLGAGGVLITIIASYISVKLYVRVDGN